MRTDGNVVYLRDEITLGSEAQAVVERATAAIQTFSADHGEPVAFAMVLTDAEGGTMTLWRTADGVLSNMALALAGAVLTAEALRDF